MNININSSINHLYEEGLISLKCKKILKSLDVSDVFDVMTTKFPEQGDVIEKENFLFREPPVIYTKNIKKEIDKLINVLYTSEEITINP